MHKDPNLRKRDALVIPGGLLATFSLLGLLYVSLLRGDDTTCGDGSQIVFAGACRSAALVLAIPLIIGVALVATGVLAFRSKATCRHGHGSWTHFGLALLIAMAAFPLLGLLVAPSVLGADASIQRGDVNYPVSTILAGLTGVGFLMLIPFAFLYAAQVKANPCCREKGCFTPCFCDEPVAEPAPEATGELPPPQETPPAEEWTAIEEPATTLPPPAPMPPAAPEPLPPAAPEPTPPAPEPEPAPKAPALYARPTDPAASTDEMAVAAKWAREDEEALEELESTPSRRRAALREKPTKKVTKKPSKKGK